MNNAEILINQTTEVNRAALGFLRAQQELRVLLNVGPQVDSNQLSKWVQEILPATTLKAHQNPLLEASQHQAGLPPAEAAATDVPLKLGVILGKPIMKLQVAAAMGSRSLTPDKLLVELRQREFPKYMLKRNRLSRMCRDNQDLFEAGDQPGEYRVIPKGLLGYSCPPYLLDPSANVAPMKLGIKDQVEALILNASNPKTGLMAREIAHSTQLKLAVVYQVCEELKKAGKVDNHIFRKRRRWIPPLLKFSD